MPNKRITSGVEAMKLLNAGVFQQVPLEIVDKVKTQVSRACEEILECGARIRPLRVNDKQIGWVRGVHLSERRILHRWLSDPLEFLTEVLLLGTSFTRAQIEEMTSIEIRSLARLLARMQEYELSVYPYMSAYSTTLSSEKLWHSRGTTLSSYSDKMIQLPNGGVMKILAPPDHANIWATLCTYREENKVKIESNLNALMITRAFVGSRATTHLSEELRRASQSLRPDLQEPWQKIVKPVREYKEDGWAHGGGDSIEELMKEMHGIDSFDKHEQLMAAFEKQQREAAEKEKDRIEDLVRKYHKDEPVWEDSMPVILSDAEVRHQEQELKKNRKVLNPIVPYESQTPQERIRRFDQNR